VPYHKLISIAAEVVTEHGFIVNSTRVQVRKDGSQMFAMLSLGKGDKSELKEFTRMLGLRSSYDKTLPNSMVFGTQVVVCSNMMFAGDIKVFRRHTLNVFEEMPELFSNAFDQGLQQFKLDVNFLRKLREMTMPKAAFGDAFILHQMLTGVLAPADVRKVYDAWRDHKEKDTLYGLHNGFTQVWRDNLNPILIPEKSQALNQAFIDSFDM
jgi:hypothetical protein